MNISLSEDLVKAIIGACMIVMCAGSLILCIVKMACIEEESHLWKWGLAFVFILAPLIVAMFFVALHILGAL